jgi:glycosyltransferase involved in cell wall biosynthesis
MKQAAEGEDRVINVLHVFSTFAVGGPQTRFATLVDRLGRGYRHSIVSMSGNTDAAALLSDRVDYELITVRNRRRNILGNVRRFGKQLRRLKPDLLITYNWGALEWAIGNRLGPRLPHIHVEDGFASDEAKRRFKRRVWLRRFGLGRSTKSIVVASRHLERIAVEEWKLPRARIVYVPNGVDIDRFSAPVPEADRAFVKRPGEVVAGTCAALRPEKDLVRLIRAFAACNQVKCRLVICGDGPERPALEAAVAANGIGDRVVFTGYLDRPELALAGFDVFAMSSVTEQTPYGLLEAMTAGLPAVATDVGDIKSMVAPANRPYIVPLIDEAALTGALRTMLGDAALRQRLGEENRAKAKAEFSLDAMIATYDRLFRDAIAKK